MLYFCRFWRLRGDSHHLVNGVVALQNNLAAFWRGVSYTYRRNDARCGVATSLSEKRGVYSKQLITALYTQKLQRGTKQQERAKKATLRAARRPPPEWPRARVISYTAYL